nr:ABC transporter G family member 11 [Ipomoea batatas]GME17741.1 ABC transporter G family member 11 [Ipomoea batatas]
MAKVNKVCLTPPVLASIYYGLNSISKSASPGQMGTHFPIHYVYGWLSAYFQTQSNTLSLVSSYPKIVIYSREGGAKHYDKTDARKRIFKGECVSWLCMSRKNDRDFIFYDYKRGSKENFEYFKCLRPSFLVLRKDPSVKSSLMYLNALVVNSDSTKRIPPACC